MANGMMDLAKASIRNHEGCRLKPYKCTAGKVTIGYGRNLDDKGISEQEADRMLHSDVLECIADLETYGYWNTLSGTRKAALLDLRFCVGPAGYRGFKKMNAALSAGDYGKAADEIMDSKFATQTGHRADDLVVMLQNG